MKRPNYLLPLIVLSQFAGTSLWFAGNAVLGDIQHELNIATASPGNITAAVQFGFITGTLLFAVLSIADRYSPSRVFFISSLLAATANYAICWLVKDATSLLCFRFVTGFFLAGIYPVGMKIAADWYEKGLGKSLGWLVGALVLGTAFPHLLKASSLHFSWRSIMLFTSLFAIAGGLLVMVFIPDGPYRKPGQGFQPTSIFRIFNSKDFRSAAFGYFGHMWELYAFWAFVPVLLALNNQYHAGQVNIPLWSFIIIAAGASGCIAGGYIAERKGSAKVAFYALLLSGTCCVLSCLFIKAAALFFLLFLLVWSIAVITDSPQFSTLVAQTAVAEYKGTALTVVTCIGFAITIGSIQLLNYTLKQLPGNPCQFILLAAGPLAGILCLYRLANKKRNTSGA